MSALDRIASGLTDAGTALAGAGERIEFGLTQVGGGLSHLGDRLDAFGLTLSGSAEAIEDASKQVASGIRDAGAAYERTKTAQTTTNDALRAIEGLAKRYVNRKLDEAETQQQETDAPKSPPPGGSYF